MLGMLRDLVRHKAWASAALLNAVQNHAGAVDDVAIRTLLHHIILANRFWLFSCLDRPFAVDVESQLPASWGDLVELFRTTHVMEGEWLAAADEHVLERRLEGPLVPGGSCGVDQAYMQVCMHSQGHRSQCASLLRARGGQPPVTDFIVWLIDRREAQWPSVADAATRGD